MSSYLPQPDSGDNCCDCSSRTSPCDDCGGGACCIAGVCSQKTLAECLSAGGGYFGDGTTCPSPDCNDYGICCRDAVCWEDPPYYCVATTSVICSGLGGGNAYLPFALFPTATCHDCDCFTCCYDSSCDGIFGCGSFAPPP